MQNSVMFTSDFIQEEFMELAIQLQKQVEWNVLEWNVMLLKSSKNIMAFSHKTHCDFRN